VIKIEKTEITPRIDSYVAVIKKEGPFFQAPFHYHPELELVYIKESCGKRIVGNSVEHFEAGDMVFLGSNIPHVWLNDEVYYAGNAKLRAKAIVLYFNKDIFGPLFYGLKENHKMITLFNQAAKGLCITGRTNTLIKQKLEKLTTKKDFEIIVGLFEILQILISSKDVVFINNESYTPINENARHDRFSKVYKFVKENYMNNLTLTAISKIANLTPSSFCRLFKTRTKKHFVEYLNEVRVSNGCKLLMESDLSISEIAYECGYKTVSNFNKLFKKITGVTPKKYRKNSVS
jgi:AraC-like DNA-binding protein